MLLPLLPLLASRLQLSRQETSRKEPWWVAELGSWTIQRLRAPTALAQVMRACLGVIAALLSAALSHRTAEAECSPQEPGHSRTQGGPSPITRGPGDALLRAVLRQTDRPCQGCVQEAAADSVCGHHGGWALLEEARFQTRAESSENWWQQRGATVLHAPHHTAVTNLLSASALHPPVYLQSPSLHCILAGLARVSLPGVGPARGLCIRHRILHAQGRALAG
jgi:hypothetical protein